MKFIVVSQSFRLFTSSVIGLLHVSTRHAWQEALLTLHMEPTLRCENDLDLQLRCPSNQCSHSEDSTGLRPGEGLQVVDPAATPVSHSQTWTSCSKACTCVGFFFQTLGFVGLCI